MFFFFFNDTATTEIYTLSLHDALPIYSSTGREQLVGTFHSRRTVTQRRQRTWRNSHRGSLFPFTVCRRSEEHTSELQSRLHLVCRLLLEKKRFTRERQCWKRYKP